jgi:hypothetical protein
MKKTIILLAIITPLLAFSQTRKEVSNFDNLKVSTNIIATLVQSDNQRVEYKMLKGSEDRLLIENKGNTLIVKTKSNGWGGSSVKAKVTIYCRQLDDLDVSAGATLSTDGEFVDNELNVSVSSGASTRLDVKGSDLDFDVSSGGSVRVNGTSDNLKIEASSGGSFNGSDLRCKNVDADVSSGGSAKVFCSESIKADASSGGSLKYYGNPEKSNIDAGYSGSVSKGK